MEFPRCKTKSCLRPRTLLLMETDTNWQFGCESCRAAWVISKPVEQDRAKFDNALQQNHIRKLQVKEYERRKKYFDIRRKVA